MVSDSQISFIDIVSGTHFSCDTVGCELWLAIISSVLCPETDRNIRIEKQGYVVILSDFIRKWCFDVSFLTSISVSTVILTLGKVEFFKHVKLRNILFTGFVKFEIKQWFSAYQDQVCAWFSLSRPPTETAREFFSGSLSKRNDFIFLLPASRTCYLPRQDFLCLIFRPVT